MKSNAEDRVLAHCLRTHGAVGNITSELTEEHFGDARTRALFLAISSVHKMGHGETVLEQDVENYLHEEMGIDNIDLEPLGEMDLGSWVNDLYLVKQHYEMERLDGKLIEASTAVQRDRERLPEILAEIDVIYKRLNSDPLTGVAMAQELLDALEHIEDMPDFIPTRFAHLNQIIGYDPKEGGLVRGSVHAVVGAPGAGKSTFVITLMVGFLQSGKTVAYANYEIAEWLWNKFFFANCTGCNPLNRAHYPEGKMEESKHNFDLLVSSWAGRVFIKHAHESLFFEDVDAWVRDLCRDKKVDVLIVDTLQSLEVGSRKYATRWQAYEHIMMRLERLALDLNLAVVITTQENVNRLKEGRETASISDTGGSIAIEQKSAVAMHIIIPDNEDCDWVEIQVTKNRVVGNTSQQAPVRLAYIDDYKGHRDYVPRPTKEDKMTELLANRVDPGLIDNCVGGMAFE